MKTVLALLFISNLLYANNNWIKLDNEDMIQEEKKKSPSSPLNNIKILDLIQGLTDPKKAISKALSKNHIKLNTKDEKISSKHKLIKTYYDNGKIRTSISYLNGIKDGIQKEFYSNGNLMIKTYYLNGKKHGVQTIYEEAGKIHKTSFYINGSLQE